jgi:magnesium chelatase family protein
VLASVSGVGLIGLEAHRVKVECVVGSGLPCLRIVGMPDTAVRESGERVRSAIEKCSSAWRQTRIVVNLAPAALPKAGGGFDLPVALAVLGALDAIDVKMLDGMWAFGELGLDGDVRPVPGVLPVATAAHRSGAQRLLVSDAAAVEAALIDGLEVVPVADLREAIAIVRGEQEPRTVAAPVAAECEEVPDLADVRGQEVARRALEIAAAGGHHLLLAGPPGCGKSMLAERMRGLLPDLSLTEALEVAAIHSVAGIRKPDAPLSRRPPLRRPHHTTSAAGLIGGGSGIPRPGELSLAHRGILFMDEILETPRWIIDSLREPLERGLITVVRSRASVTYPGRVILVAAANPCPCGHLGDDRRPCRCRPDQIERYRSRLSGPLLDRIDVQVELAPVDADQLLEAPDGESTAVVADRVRRAREAAAERWRSGHLVRDVPIAVIRNSCSDDALQRTARAVDALGLSARAFNRCLRVARTIADLDGGGSVRAEHVDEAVAYRLPDLVTVP